MSALDAGEWDITEDVNASVTLGSVGDPEPDAGRDTRMAAMKPRTGDGPLEVVKEGRGIVMRVPLEGGGRLVSAGIDQAEKLIGEAEITPLLG